MPRISRVVAVGHPHHITQRGNYRQPVFEDEDDFIQYLHWLKEYCLKYSLNIWAYCLMNNHVHFLAVPMKDDSLSKTFNTLHVRYSQYFNQKRKARGHLWQGRFR
ncbi:MAG: transposase [Deltaproteobacteria bacterium]|nr:transposase [Deltaproteobacteria bacterium]